MRLFENYTMPQACIYNVIVEIGIKMDGSAEMEFRPYGYKPEPVKPEKPEFTAETQGT